MIKKLLNGIGLGTFPFASPFSFVDERTAEEILQSYLDNGGQYIDTAPIYAFYKVETFLGQVLKKIPREKYFISTSCGYILNQTGKFEISGKYSDVINNCEGSLKRLNVEYIDLYISHIPDLKTPVSETMGALKDLKKQGKVKRLGVSNVALVQLKEYNIFGGVEYVQNRFSLLNQNFSDDFIKHCNNNDIGLVAYQVIERGLLTNKASEIGLREGDFRNNKPEFAVQIRTRIGQWIREYLLPIANELKIDVSTLAIWWAMQQPAIAMCQIGATSVRQVTENMKALYLTPPTDTLTNINKAYQILQEEIEREYSQTIREFRNVSMI
jgi:aryl-alcohol dehydrogenase-like predicted oxidoreductase